MRRALALLLILTGLAGAGFGWLQAKGHDCLGLEHEANAAAAALDLCAKSFSCRFTYRDLIAVARQRVAANRCRASQP